MPHFGQEFFEMAVSTDTTSQLQYAEAHARAHAAAGPNGIDRLLAEHNLTALIAPTTGPAFEITLGEGDAFAGGSTTLPAVAGYPHLTVPAGMVDELPVGLSFIGPAWSEAKLLALGYAFEQLKQWRTPPTLH
jgi:amidase